MRDLRYRTDLISRLLFHGMYCIFAQFSWPQRQQWPKSYKYPYLPHRSIAYIVCWYRYVLYCTRPHLHHIFPDRTLTLTSRFQPNVDVDLKVSTECLTLTSIFQTKCWCRPVFRIRIRLDPHSNWAWIRDPDPYSESGSGFRIQVSKNRLKKLKFTRTDLNDENRKMLWLSWNFNHSFLSLFQEHIALGNFLLSCTVKKFIT
jgi:hypothetical protein